MPRRASGPRLYFRRRAGRPGVYVILDTGRPEVSTGFGADGRGDAEKALQDYIAKKHRPTWRSGEPSEVAVADVLSFYATENAVQHVHPELVGYHLPNLLAHFGDKTCFDVDGALCRSYVAQRTSGRIGKRPVSEGTARRELETLSAALNFAYKERRITVPIPVTFPAKAPARHRWLRRGEAAALLAGALGIVPIAYDIGTRQPIKWGRMFRPVYHVARFILIALYTGTRHEAVLRLGWSANPGGGWFDLEHAILYRRGSAETESNKRRPPAPIPDNLVPHLRRWRRLTTVGPVEYAGRLILKERRGFDRARKLAGLDDDVTPHALRHTCATWLLQSRVSTWDVAGFLGTSEQVIRKTYGHHSPDHLEAPRTAFLGRKLGAAQRRAA